MNRKKAAKEIQTLWNQILDLWKDNFDIYELRLRTKLNEKTKIPELLIDFKKKRVPSQHFKVIFDDGSVLSTETTNGDYILSVVVSRVGYENVQKMNITTASGRNIVENDSNSPTGYSIFKKTSNAEKKYFIRRILDNAPIAKYIDIDN